MVLYPDTLSALLRLKDHYLFFIVTHQPGIGLGILSLEDVKRVNDHLVSALSQAGVAIASVYCCPHGREQDCECIKPKPHFLLQAAAQFNVDLSRSYVIGDHPHDVELARNEGATGIYLLTGHGQKHLGEIPRGVFVAENMDQAARRILETGSFSSKDSEAIHRAAEIIRRGGVVALPTETVYGLGADAFNPLAVARIFEVKNRPYFDPLIVHIADLGELSRLASHIPPDAERLIQRCWPGPLTIVLFKKEDVPDIVTAGLPTVAVRMPNHPMALRLIQEAGCPIAAPSANPFGYVSPTTADHVRGQLGDRVDLILDGGACAVGLESTIISFLEKRPRLLRPGGLPLEEIEQIVGAVEVHSTEEERPFSPGRLPSHYAPRTPILIAGARNDRPAYQDQSVGLLAFREVRDPSLFHSVEVLSAKGDLREAAANLFAAIRRLDALNLNWILAEPVPEQGLGRAIMDRLSRASTKRESNK